MEELLFTIPIIALIAYIFHLHITSKHEERMALIESGQDATLLRDEFSPKFMGALKWGIIFIAIGLGFGIGLFIDLTFGNQRFGPLFTICFTIISGGIGLLIYYNMAKNERENRGA